MVFKFTFPDVGEGIQEGQIVSWKVKEGDTVTVDQTLGEVETDKAVVELPSPKAGTILKLHAKPGDTVKVGSTIVTIGEKGESAITETKAPKETGETKKQKEKKQKKEKPKGASVVGVLEVAEESAKKLVEKEHKEGKVIPAAPKARKLAAEKGKQLSSIKGTGPDGAVLVEDIEGASDKSAKVCKQPEKTDVKKVRKYDMYGMVKRIPYSGVRKIIGERMAESLYTATHVTHHDEADVTELSKIRDEEKGPLKEKGIKLTFLPFIIKALESALKDHPMLNSSLSEEEGNIIVKQYYNIGIAVDTEAGLIVPVIKRVNQKGILQIAKEIVDLAEKGKTRKLDPMDMKGGTFTITNYGSIGGIYASPIINFPECAILGLGKIQDKVKLIDGELYVRKMLPISISFDHRITDGAEVARFANTIIKQLEDPDLLMLDVGFD